MSSKIDELPLPPVAVMDGSEAAGTVEVSAPSAAPRLAPNIVLADAVDALDRARFEARQCRSAVLEARSAFSKALAGWNATQPIQTVEDLKKEWIASNQRERERKVEAGRGIHYAGVTATARALSGGNMRRSPAAYKRGAYSRAEAKAANALRAAAATAAAKLPSRR